MTQVTQPALAPGELRRVLVGDVGVCIARTDDGQYFAVQDLCSHGRASLAEGYLRGHRIQCPRHGALFDLATGAPASPPAAKPLTTYFVSTDGDFPRITVGGTDQAR